MNPVGIPNPETFNIEPPGSHPIDVNSRYNGSLASSTRQPALHASTICRFRNPYHKRNQASSNAALWWMRLRLIHDFYHCSFVIRSINTSFSVKNKASIAKTVNEAWLSMFISCLCEITWKKNRNMLKNENYSIKK